MGTNERLLEKDLYPIVYNYLDEKFTFEEGGSAEGRPINLSLFGTRIYPDIYGVSGQGGNAIIVMGEGKRSLNGREFDICKGQGISLQRFSDYVYLFFPDTAWQALDMFEKEQCISECKHLKLGLLSVNLEKGSCEEICKPQVNKSLLNNDSKAVAIKTITDYFPDFSKDNHINFCKQFYVGNNIMLEGLELMNYLSKSKVNPIITDEVDRVFVLDGDYETLTTGEKTYLQYFPFGLGLAEGASEPFDKEHWRFLKPMLTLNSNLERNLSLSTGRDILNQYLKKVNDTTMIIADAKNGSLSGCGRKGEHYELSTNFEDQTEETLGDMTNIYFMIDIPIFNKSKEEIKNKLKNIYQSVDDLSKELNSIRSRF